MKRRLAAVFLIVSSIVISSGCSAAHRDLRQKARETNNLTERVSECWMALRWADTQTSAGCIEHAEERLSFLKRLSSRDAMRVSEARVVQVELSDRLPPTDAPALFRAKVVLQVECVKADTQQVTNRFVLESWVRKPEGWFVEPTQEAGVF
jgi:hypothetical protein